MGSSVERWEDIYNRVPLAAVPGHYANVRQSPYLMEYLMEVLRLAPRGGRTLETGIGSGFGAIWLSQRSIQASGIDASPRIVERACQVNNLLGGHARFTVSDLFDLYSPKGLRYDVIHHQGVLEHFTVPQIRAALAQQVAMADWVVFSVPSVHYPYEPEAGDERLLPIEEWERIIAPFDVKQLTYYGDPRLGGREHIRCILNGQEVNDTLRALMKPDLEPYPEGISAIVHTRNEAGRIVDCLESLKGWADEIIVCDMESEDATVEIASRYTDQIVRHRLIANFDTARNVSAMRAKYRWVFYLDADERVPAALGQALRHAISSQGDQFEALLVPFRHHFAGHWMQCLYPGYTAPRLFKNGKFFFNPRLHAGAQVDGRVILFPGDNPDLALVHYSFDSMAHYLDKLNRYTDGEALNLYRDGQQFNWQRAVSHFVGDMKGYYAQGSAAKDDVHGFVYSFCSGFYRFFQYAKLYEHRYRESKAQPDEKTVPQSVEEMLEYALAVARQRPKPIAPQIRVLREPDAASIVWSGPLRDPSGYGEESRHLLFALDKALRETDGLALSYKSKTNSVSAQSLPWSDKEAKLTQEDRQLLDIICGRPAGPGFVQIVHNFPMLFDRHPEAKVCIGRTTFETDRLPQDWVKACNKMDYIWVPTEFNLETFTSAGIDPKKLVVVPECLDAAFYAYEPSDPETPEIVRSIKESASFAFLTVFDWTLHKGWDVLLRAFLEEFQADEDVQLVLKVWSTNGYSDEQIRLQAADYARNSLGIDLSEDQRIRFVSDRLSPKDMLGLYYAADCYVMPSRGEGWGRPYMEAMACGLPVIGTGWSGNTAFMNVDNSYLIDYTLVPVPEQGWREVPTYKGHRWAEPDCTHLRRLMRHVVEHPEEGKAVGQAAREHISANFSRDALGPIMVRELARVMEEHGLSSSSSDVSSLNIKEIEFHTNGHTPKAKSSFSVRWEGAFLRWHSLAHVNREFCLGLKGAGIDLSLVPTEPNEFSPTDELRFVSLAERFFAPLGKPASVHVRHHFPPRFDKPDEGRLVLIQPWEYGYLPKEWIEPIQKNVDEAWCHSRYVLDVYKHSGIEEEKLKLVPLGVDTTIFHPGVPPYIFTSEIGADRTKGRNPFTFLYVGGTIRRKGIDILLDAYLRAFSAADDVCLVVKDTGTNTVYPDNAGARIKELATDRSRPRIVYLNSELSAHQMAGIYTAADCLAQPYRGEGFCLPVLEAMACGVPAIVPEGGSTDDFVDETVGWRLAATRKPLQENKIGPWQCVEHPWEFEIDIDQLAEHLRGIRNRSEELRLRGEAAAERVRVSWTWQHACEVVVERLQMLSNQKPNMAQPVSNRIAKPADTNDAAKKNGNNKVTGRPKVSRSASKEIDRTIKQSHPTISLCMIVKNEERVLGDCLASIKQWVDEMIVVDTGSTDRTIDIAKEHGAKVFHFPWTDSFSEARNESLKYATCDWILWMDADDTIPEDCGRRLHDLVLIASEKVTGLLMQVQIPSAPGEHGYTIVDHVKLFRNGLGLKFEGRIHEQILEPIYRIGGTVERSDLYVVHSGYDHSPEGQKKKRARDLSLLEKDLTDRPDHPFVLFNIGMTAFHMKDYAKAMPALERCLALSKPHESTVRKVYAMLAGCAFETRDFLGAKRWVEQGLAQFPKDPELLFRAGTIYRGAGDLKKAEESYVKLLTEREFGHIDSLDVTMTGHKAHHNLGLIYLDMGRLSDAEAQWKAAVQKAPDFAPSWLGLTELYLKTGRREEARHVAEALERISPKEATSISDRLLVNC
jgi:glycosyltransferase involved in cell wall biosynthesis